MAGKIFIFGAGYSGQALARKMLEAGWRVAGTTRSQDKADTLRAMGIEALLFDGDNLTGEIEGALASTTHLVISIAPNHGLRSDASETSARTATSSNDRIDPVLTVGEPTIRAKMPELAWIGYWSTVGVYGDHGGAWVDEDAECRPASRRAEMRVAAEAEWRALGQARDIPVAVMRLAGIYGPGRNAFSKLQEGTARRVVKPGQVFSRIHVDDIVGATALLAGRSVGGVYNIADGEPAPPQDVIAFAARLMGVETPPDIPFDQADMSPMARSFYGDNKRVSNAKIRAEGYDFQFPDYRTALERMWRDGSWR